MEQGIPAAGRAATSPSTDTRKLVKRAERNPWNRLLSIVKDAEWVALFCRDNVPQQFPIVPNLRCGAWYVPQSLISDSETMPMSDRGCYFKSTDGHTHEWDFSLKRYNLDLVHLIEENGGCIIIDSTRRGKSMPDALSKTVPIWCAVLNAAVAQKYGTLDNSRWATLKTPRHVVSQSEHAQIDERISKWTRALLTSDLTLPRLSKSLWPVFVSRKECDEDLKYVQATSSTDLHYFPVILISASEQVSTPALEPRSGQIHARSGSSALRLADDLKENMKDAAFVYVQGSGDDEEAWASGLRPESFWQEDNLRAILSTAGRPLELEKCMNDITLAAKARSLAVSGSSSSVARTDNDTVQIGRLPVFLGQRQRMHAFPAQELEAYDLILHIDGLPPPDAKPEAGDGAQHRARIHRFNIESGKRGLNAFRAAIPLCTTLAQQTLPKPVLVCSTEAGPGNDHCAGIAVAILAHCFNADTSLRSKDRENDFPSALTKDDIRRRLQWMTSMVPDLKAPSRAHMLRINEALLSPEFRLEAKTSRSGENHC